MLQYFHDGEEYTTRARLLDIFDLPRPTLQVILRNAHGVKKVQDMNKFYFHKQQVEALLDQHGVKRLQAA